MSNNQQHACASFVHTADATVINYELHGHCNETEMYNV